MAVDKSDMTGLTPEDKKLLQWVLDEARKRWQNAQSRPPVGHDQPHQAPEVYIAITPEDGIPGLTFGEGTGTGTGGDSYTPGSAECNIYQIVGGILVYAGFSKIIYNLSVDAIPRRTAVETSRDKFGEWLISGMGSDIVGVTLTGDLSSTGTSTDEVACIVRSDWDPGTETFSGSEIGVFVDPEHVFSGAVSGATGYARKMQGNGRVVYLGVNLNCGQGTGT